MVGISLLMVKSREEGVEAEDGHSDQVVQMRFYG